MTDRYRLLRVSALATWIMGSFCIFLAREQWLIPFAYAVMLTYFLACLAALAALRAAALDD